MIVDMETRVKVDDLPLPIRRACLDYGLSENVNITIMIAIWLYAGLRHSSISSLKEFFERGNVNMDQGRFVKVGVAEDMPGTKGGFTMAVFPGENVSRETILYKKVENHE